ncbi:hypothetical protein Taro_046169 [Colocasia esculenta]|uniref:Uncharacterized protein n=1 Tax=Colocasia esculenta TaxID=4460 RepID=A0A843X594_COLES|nr:hypothetical protein [Colocasia esculenta]
MGTANFWEPTPWNSRLVVYKRAAVLSIRSLPKLHFVNGQFAEYRPNKWVRLEEHLGRFLTKSRKLLGRCAAAS